MKLVLFDCDGTLVDSQHNIVAAMNQAFRLNELPELPASRVITIVGLSLREAVQRLVPDQRDDRIDAVTAHYREAFGALRRDAANEEPMYPGMLELIETLSMRGDVQLGVATGKSVRGVNALFARVGLEPYFSTIQTADTHPSKPHPSMIARAMRETGVEPSNTVMIGDTTFDMTMARNAAVHGIGVGWGYHPSEDLADAGARSIAADADALLAAIDTAFDVQGPADR